MGIKATVDLRQLYKRLDALGRTQIPYSVRDALNGVAAAAKADIEAAMKTHFDRPTPYTMRALFVKKANAKTLEAEVKIKDEAFKSIPPVKWLAAEVYGGERGNKRSENALRRNGILKAGQMLVPGEGAKLNQYGNLTGGLMTQILSVLKASADQYQNQTDTSRKRNRKPREFFAVTEQRGGLRPGVWERLPGRRVRPVLIFVDGAKYRERLPFFALVNEAYARDFARLFNEALARNIADKQARNAAKGN